MRAADSDRVLTALVGRVVARHSAGRLEDVLSDAVYHERRRLRGTHGSEADFWSELQGELSQANSRAQQELCRRIARRYAEEICGTFDDRVYQAVTRAGEPVLGMLLNAMSPKRLLQGVRAGARSGSLEAMMAAMPRLDSAIGVGGATERLLALRQHGTIVLVPTHVSHIDSVAVGWALWKMQLPPFLYGAGLNLFGNPMLGFFLRNLGAYTVDRRKTCPLYKDVLKEYATLTLENGYDNIFFPGGTRSRSGALESKLKLGLLGTGVAAYQHNLKNGVAKPKVFFVPATLSYQLVLEAETLVDDFLQEVGKSRYIITDDEASQPRRVVDFVTQLLSLDSKIAVTIGDAIDPFGNAVDDDGNSLDPNGRVIDPRLFVSSGGELCEDVQRDAEYTTEVGHRIVDGYRRLAKVQCTHVVSHAAMALLRKNNPGVDLMRLLRAGGKHNDMPLPDLYAEVDRQLLLLRAMRDSSTIGTGPWVEASPAIDVVNEAMRHFASYHSRRALTRRGDRVEATDRSLLFYYSNRLEGYDLLRPLGLGPSLSADHRSLQPNRSAL